MAQHAKGGCCVQMISACQQGSNDVPAAANRTRAMYLFLIHRDNAHQNRNASLSSFSLPRPVANRCASG